MCLGDTIIHYRRVVDMTDSFRRKGGRICFHLSPQITDEFMWSTSILVSGFLYENPVLIWVPHVSGPSWCSFNLIFFVELLSPQKTTSKVLAVKAVMLEWGTVQPLNLAKYVLSNYNKVHSLPYCTAYDLHTLRPCLYMVSGWYLVHRNSTSN